MSAPASARPTQGLRFAEAGNQGFGAGDDEEIPVRSRRDGGLADHNGVGAGPLIVRDCVNDTNRIAIARINVRDDRQPRASGESPAACPDAVSLR